MKSQLFKIIPLLFVLSSCSRVPSGSATNTNPIVPEVSPITGIPTVDPTPKQIDPSETKIALVYAGPGVCEDDCAASAAESARLAGLTPRLVMQNSLPDSATPAEVEAFYKNAAVWIEPGGKSKIAWQGMTQTLRTTLKEFIRTGGGYVGFCAGAFMSTKLIGSTGVEGLGVMPGNTYLYRGSMIETIDWEGEKKNIYWEGGPYLYNLDSTVEVTALYKNFSVAAARTQFGAGRVYVVGPHPEAPGWWSNQGPTSDISGPTQQVAADMIKWSARMQ